MNRLSARAGVAALTMLWASAGAGPAHAQVAEQRDEAVRKFSALAKFEDFRDLAHEALPFEHGAHTFLRKSPVEAPVFRLCANADEAAVPEACAPEALGEDAIKLLNAAVQTVLTERQQELEESKFEARRLALVGRAARLERPEAPPEACAPPCRQALFHELFRRGENLTGAAKACADNKALCDPTVQGEQSFGAALSALEAKPRERDSLPSWLIWAVLLALAGLAAAWVARKYLRQGRPFAHARSAPDAPIKGGRASGLLKSETDWPEEEQAQPQPPAPEAAKPSPDPAAPAMPIRDPETIAALVVEKLLESSRFRDLLSATLGDQVSAKPASAPHEDPRLIEILDRLGAIEEVLVDRRSGDEPAGAVSPATAELGELVERAGNILDQLDLRLRMRPADESAPAVAHSTRDRGSPSAAAHGNAGAPAALSRAPEAAQATPETAAVDRAIENFFSDLGRHDAEGLSERLQRRYRSSGEPQTGLERVLGIFQAAHELALQEGVTFRAFSAFRTMLEGAGILPALAIVVPTVGAGQSPGRVAARNSFGNTQTVERVHAPGLRSVLDDAMLVKPVIDWAAH